jgi:hypothetical protein
LKENLSEKIRKPVLVEFLLRDMESVSRGDFKKGRNAEAAHRKTPAAPASKCASLRLPDSLTKCSKQEKTPVLPNCSPPSRASIDLVILDELGYVPFDTGAQLSLVFTTSFPCISM